MPIPLAAIHHLVILSVWKRTNGDAGDIAEVAVTVLMSAGHEGKIYPLTGPEALTMTKVAERLSVVTGKEIVYVDVSPEEATRANLARGVPPIPPRPGGAVC